MQQSTDDIPTLEEAKENETIDIVEDEGLTTDNTTETMIQETTTEDTTEQADQTDQTEENSADTDETSTDQLVTDGK